MTTPLVERAFLRTPHGLIHYRFTEGCAPSDHLALVLAHGGPGSSSGMAPLMQVLSERRTIAPDMMGNGESDPPPQSPTTIDVYADGLLRVLDRLEVARADFYGHHTGAQVICEFAIAHPDRVRRLILDGIPLFSDQDRQEYAERYAPKLVPDAEGRHLAELWDFVVNMTRYFPHYQRDASHKVGSGLALSPAVLTNVAAEVLKVWSTFPLAYEAAFRHDVGSRLPLVHAPTLILQIEGDPLAVFARQAADLMIDAQLRPTRRTDRAEAIRDFLNG